MKRNLFIRMVFKGFLFDPWPPNAKHLRLQLQLPSPQQKQRSHGRTSIDLVCIVSQNGEAKSRQGENSKRTTVSSHAYIVVVVVVPLLFHLPIAIVLFLQPQGLWTSVLKSQIFCRNNYHQRTGKSTLDSSL